MAYTLEQFSADCHRLLAAEPGPEGRKKICALVQKACADPEFVRQYLPESGPERKILYEDPELGFCILGHVYQSAKESQPHDHGPTWAIYGQAFGETIMTQYECLARASADRLGKARPVREYKLRPATKRPTVRHFLTHTSGLAYPFTSATWRDFKPKPGETYPFGGPLLVEPGERWHYSTSTDVVGRLVEVISGQKLEDYFRQHIFAPLKMTDTSYNVPQEKAPRLVAAQQRAGERMDGAVVLQSPQPGLTIAAPIGGGGLASTAGDYGRFMRMLLNGGALDGVRVLKAETVALMGQNHIGAIGVPALKSALPRSADFNFIADGRDKFGLGFLITTDQVPGKRSPGSLSWGGINNTYFWVDPSRGIGGVIMMQYLPFADPKALALHEAFERAAYRLAAAQPTAARDERFSPVASR